MFATSRQSDTFFLVQAQNSCRRPAIRPRRPRDSGATAPISVLRSRGPASSVPGHEHNGDQRDRQDDVGGGAGQKDDDALATGGFVMKSPASPVGFEGSIPEKAT